MSYTTFEYSDLHLSALTPYSFEVSCKIRNTGKYDGEEVVQLYLRDEYASVVQPLSLIHIYHYESWNINPNEVTPEQMERDNLLTGAYFTQMERGIFVVGKDKGGLFEETQMLTGDRCV